MINRQTQNETKPNERMNVRTKEQMIERTINERRKEFRKA